VNPGGILNVVGGDLTAAGTSTNDGTVTVANTRTANFNGNTSGAGSFTGPGTVAFNAVYSPGNNGTAVVSFAGKTVLGPASTLDIELGGQTPGSQYDALHVTGQLSLAGLLNLTFTNAATYMPAAGNSFNLLDWGSLAGTFASISLPSLPGGLVWDTSQLYATGVVSIGGVLGDYNLNGTVDAADFALWRHTLGQSGASSAADGNFNHHVDLGDLDIWTTNFGQLAGGAGAGFSAAVPEPSSAILILPATLLLIRLRKRSLKR
jgi:hypothetical protein